MLIRNRYMDADGLFIKPRTNYAVKLFIHANGGLTIDQLSRALVYHNDDDPWDKRQLLRIRNETLHLANQLIAADNRFYLREADGIARIECTVDKSQMLTSAFDKS